MARLWPLLWGAAIILAGRPRHYWRKYDDALLRTLQRRVQTWNASHGKEREVFFPQAHPPGRLGLSYLTHAAVLLRFPNDESDVGFRDNF